MEKIIVYECSEHDDFWGLCYVEDDKEIIIYMGEGREHHKDGFLDAIVFFDMGYEVEYIEKDLLWFRKKENEWYTQGIDIYSLENMMEEKSKKEEPNIMKIIEKIIVVDILPKNCNKCPFNERDFEGRPYCSQITTTEENPYKNSLAYWEFTGPDARKRKSNCPLTEKK